MDDRTRLMGVLYAEDFDVGDDPPATDPAPPDPEPELIEPSFTAAELDAARRDAHDAGRQAAERGLAASRLHMLTLVAKGLADTRAEAAQVAADTAEAVARCLLGSLAACLPALCHAHGPAELRAMTRRVLPSLAGQPRVTIRVNPHMMAMMRAEVATLDDELTDAIVLVPTDAIPPGDARITWQDGAAIRDAAGARTTVNDALAALGLLQEETADA